MKSASEDFVSTMVSVQPAGGSAGHLQREGAQKARRALSVSI